MNSAERQNHGGHEDAIARGAAGGGARTADFEAGGQRIAPWITRQLAAAWAACGAFEWVALGYLAASSALIAVFAENLAHPVKLVSVQALVATMILALCLVEAWVRERARGPSETFSAKFWRFWRHWYPHLFFLFCFEELGKFVHLVTPGWQDAKLMAADHWLTGVDPAVWMEQFATPARNDFMQFAYLTYFGYLLFLGGVFFRGRSRVGRGVVGSMASPAVAVLGNVAAGRLHVCFDSVGTVPLRGGCVRRNGHRDAGVCDRWLGNDHRRLPGDGSR